MKMTINYPCMHMAVDKVHFSLEIIAADTMLWQNYKGNMQAGFCCRLLHHDVQTEQIVAVNSGNDFACWLLFILADLLLHHP